MELLQVGRHLRETWLFKPGYAPVKVRGGEDMKLAQHAAAARNRPTAGKARRRCG